MKITLAAALTVLCLTGAKAQSWCTNSDKLFGSCDRPDWRSKWIFKAFDHCYCSGKQLLNEQGYVNFEHCYPNVNPGSFFLQVADGFQCDVTVFANSNCDYGGQTFYGKGNTVQNYFAASANSIRLSCWGN